MDSANIKLQFIDLEGANEHEKHEIEEILFTPGWHIKLPWGTRSEPEENHGEVAVEQLQEEEEQQQQQLQEAVSCDDVIELIPSHPDNHQEWQEYVAEEQTLIQDEAMEALQPPPPMRGPGQFYGQYMVMTPAMGMPPYSMPYMPPHQSHYGAPAYYNEAEPPQARPRGGRGRDKRVDHQHQHQHQAAMQPPPQQYLPYVPMPMMHYLPYSMGEYPQPGPYQLHPDQPPFHPEPQFHHPHPHMELEQPLPPKVDTQLPIAPIEHLCYTTNVTVKAPKKKQPEEVAPVLPPVEAPPAPVVVQQPVPTPVTPVAPAVPVPTAAPVPAAAAPTLPSPAPAAAPAPEVIAEPPKKEIPPLPVTQDVAEPLPPRSPPPTRAADPAAPKVPGDYPRLNGSATAALSPSQDNRSWAKLFHGPPQMGAAGSPQSVSLKPLARVPPAPRQTPSVGDAANQDVKAARTPSVPSPVNFNAKPDYRITDDPYTVRLVSKLREARLDHRAMNLTPRGLTNPSNYCYVNAILQALIACPPLFNLLKSLPVPQDPRQAARTPIIGSMIELVQQFHQLPSKQKRREKSGRDETPDLPSGTSFEPRCVYKVLDKIRGDSSFSVEGRQEDAEEFLSCLLNGLNDEMFEVMKLMGVEVVTELTNGDAGSDSDSATQEWKVMGPKNRGAITRRAVCGNTPISEIFRGQQRSRVVREGGDNTDSVQPFFTLQLDVEKAVSVKQALDLLMNKDVLEGMTCSRTNREIEAWTQTTLEELPIILTLHLKCFDYKHDGCSKITKIVDYSVDLKIESKLVTGTKYTAKQKSYKLIAVVYHDGKEATKGHYVTDVYHVGLGVWIRYDDGNVRSVKEEHVLKPISPRVPYLLFYRRSDTASTASSAPPPPAPAKS